MVARTLKMIGNVLDWCLSAILTGLFFAWLFNYITVYKLFNKIFIVIG